ncbi:MAG: hypothetical protein IKU55_04075, partial [Clostridia bacterium]|nr:hypothetical protein [Clostridia bacterium]
DLAVSYPAKTAVFKETEDGPKQIFPCFAASYSNLADAEVTIDGRQTVQLGAMRAGECKLIRAEAPAVGHAVGVPVALKTAQSEATEGEFQVLTGLLPALRGESLVMTSFHFDTTYHQEQRVYALGAIYITREILKEMRRDRNFKAIISEIDYLHPYYSLYPEDREFLKQMFVEGNTESDCFYNQPNEMTSSGEGVVRNLVYGQLYHRDVMGRICDVYSPGDVFGHFNQMSQLSAKGGCGGVYWGKHILGFWPSFRHISPDGTWLNHRRGGVGLGDATAWDLSFAEHIGYSMANVPGFPVDGDLSWMAETAPAARYAVPSELRAAADRDEARFAAEGKRSPFEATSRDMSLYHAGVSLTRMDFKQANRMAENLLITAEKLSVIAALNGAEYPERALDKAWRQVLCGQHHDSITGTNNEVSFVDLMIEYREAVELAAEICERASKYIAAHVCKDAGKRAVVLFNPHTWDRAEHTELTLKNDKPMGGLMVTDANGEAVRAEVVAERAVDGGYEADLLLYTTVPACGYVVCYVEEMPQLALNLPKVDGETCIENEFYKIVVDPMVGGGIVSLFDKENNRELINANGDGPANRLVALKETHDRMETQHEFYTTGHKLLSDWEEASVQRTVGAEFATLTVRYELGNVVHVTQEITLKAGDRRIDFKTRLDDYRDEDDLFTVTFPVTIKNAKPIFDDRFAPAVRNASRRALSFRTHQMLMASHCAVYPANQWMDYGPSVTMFLNDETANGALQLGMTQIIRANDRAIMDAADELLVALTKKAIPVTPFPDVKQEFRGSQIPHFNEDLTSETRFVLSVNGVANVYEEALAARYPDAYARLTAAAAAETAVAYFADTDNDWQKPIDVLLVKAPTYEALNAWVEATAKALADGRTFSQKAIVADALAEADDYGVAIINTGNIACSVEKGDMLNMMLFHTAEFYGNVGNTNCDVKLVPEKKSHIFTYSLLPHAGSYREAQLFRRALEKNDPLFAVADVETVADAAMPASYSLVKTNEDVIVTAVKAGGYPMASMKGNFGTIADRGVAIRFFEENGMSGEAKLSLGFAADLAETANLLEEDRKPAALADGTVTIPVTPHTIETLVIRPTEAKVGNAEIGANREVTEPTYVRSWEHDLGTMPMGYLALCA